MDITPHDSRQLEDYKGSLEYHHTNCHCHGMADFRNWQDYREDANFFEADLQRPKRAEQKIKTPLSRYANPESGVADFRV